MNYGQPNENDNSPADFSGGTVLLDQARVPLLVCVLSLVLQLLRLTGACPVTTALIIRVNVRTTTTRHVGW